jgi:hypothetical protein
MDFLDLRDEQVQDFLWRHLVASDIRHDYTRADAMQYVYGQLASGEQWLIGDMDAGLAFRCVLRNPRVLEPHIMGNALRLRSLMPAALALVWPRGVQQVLVWTQHAAIARILARLGFTHEATVRRVHLEQGELLDVHALSLAAPPPFTRTSTPTDSRQA